MSYTPRTLIVTVCPWLGRLLALLLVLFWGSFFVEHLSEWFLRPDGQFPGPRVWVAQFFHLGILVGLLLMLRWDKVGTLVTVLASMGFFITAGLPITRPIPLINLVPILCFVVPWILQQRVPKPKPGV